ncbi:MAG: tetratricopeptide repeat protein, partial [Chromatiales bacterium]
MSFFRHHIMRAGALAACVLWSTLCPAADSLEQARKWLDDGNPKAAVIELKNVLQSDPANAGARILLGDVYLRLGDAQSAEKEFRRAADLGAEKPRWQAGLGEALLRQGRFDELLWDIPPDDSQPGPHRQTVLELRGRAWIGEGDLDRALTSFDQALEIGPPTAAALVGKARVRALRGDTGAALELAGEALALDDRSLDALTTRAELLRREGDIAGSLRDYARAVELYPWSPQARLGLATARAVSGDLEAALAELDRLDERVGNLATTVFLRGVIYARLGRLAEAEEQVQLILRGTPEDARAQLLYGVIAYARNKPDLAADMLSRAVAKMPAQPDILKLLGAIRLKLGDNQGARQALEQALEAAPEDPQLLA